MDNKFPASELKHLSILTGLQSISLANNSIENFEDLEPLTKIENLVQLDLSDTKLSERGDYREKVFQMFSNLHILDNLDSEGRPFEYSDDSDPDDYVPGESEGEEEGDEQEILRQECEDGEEEGVKENVGESAVNNGKRAELEKVTKVGDKVEPIKKVKEN